jgi:phenylacetate-CoA ligase
MSDIRDPLGLADYTPGAAVALSDEERWPALGSTGRARLDAVLADPAAPPWRHRTGHRLSPDAAARARLPLPLGGWLQRHLATARALPAYRRFPGALDRLSDFPIIDRDDLLADVSAFVPFDADLSRMVQGSSSGSTGAALSIPDDIEDVARTFWLLVDLLRELGIDLEPDPDRMALAYLVHQRQAFTYASPVPGFGAAPMARLNLHPGEWPAADRDDFLSRHDPQVISGSPTSLDALLRSTAAATLHPVAVVTGAMHLSAALRAELEATFACPVLDIYGLHETRPIAVSPDGGPFRVLDRPVLVEILGPDGESVQPGERGEIVVTAASNPLLPLVRYRTSDFGRLEHVDGRPAIADLEGREDVRFLAADGREVPCVDLTQYLQDAGVLGWSVSQDRSGAVRATLVAGDADAAGERLRALLGRPVEVTVASSFAELGAGKPRRYRRE